MFVDIAIVIAAGVLILSSKNFVKRIDLYAKVKKQPVVETEDKPTETEENWYYCQYNKPSVEKRSAYLLFN